MQNVVALVFLSFVSFPIWAQTMDQKQEFAQRIDSFSEGFLGLPYLVDPLGEGQGRDPDPLYRFDGFDCTTYVETVLSLARAVDELDFERQMLKIRYSNGIPEFFQRNHFTDADWVPNNVKKGVLRDITHEVDERALTAQATIDRSNWFKKVHQLEFKVDREQARLPFIALDRIERYPAILDRIPSGAVINIVRPNWNLEGLIGTRLNVSHQGFAIRKSSGELYFRHASQTYLRITEEPLLGYLRKMKEIPSVGGINVLSPVLSH